MEKLSLKELAIPMIKAIDSFNFLLKSHHRKVAVISYYLGKDLNLKEDELLELVIAASLHDIGALSVQERDMLIKEDVLNPKPHCIMGYHMLTSFEAFKNIAQIIKHHHIRYEDSLKMPKDEIPFASHIIHLADRVDISITADDFILDQKNEIIDKIGKKAGRVFHPDVFKSFEKVSKADIFWIEITNLQIEQLFKKMNFTLNFELTIDKILDFALTISHIIDFRSKFTASHSYTVAQLAFFIGQLMGYSDEKCKKLKIAGFLHDIGKIGIDPSLIEKNGQLTEKEFNIMKLHPYYTSQILNELNSSAWFREIVSWAEKHHEKIDGTGYPYSLKSSEIDDGVKVLAYADIITALMEDRPYRGSLSIDETLGIINEKFAKELSVNMFDTILEYKDEINTLVRESQGESLKKYQLSLKE